MLGASLTAGGKVQIGIRPARWNPILMGWPTGEVSLMVRALHGWIKQLHSVEAVASTAHPRMDVGRLGDMRPSRAFT